MEDTEYYTYSPYFAGLDKEDAVLRRNFLKLFGTLPEPIRSFLTAEETAEKILALGRSLGLGAANTEQLSRNIRRIASGELFLGKALETCQRELGLDRAAVADALNRVLNEVLVPVIEEVKSVQRDSFINPVPKLQPRPIPKPMAPAPAPAAPVRPSAPAPLPATPPKPPPAPAQPAQPRQIPNLGYLLQDQPATATGQPGNPNNVLNLRNPQK